MTEPVEKTVRVRCSVPHAFRVFTERIDLWWPSGHRRDPGSVIFLEAGEGGRFGERLPGGEERVLGVVLEWDPPERLVYSWWPGAIDAPTRVEVRFLEEGTDATRVEVRHSVGDSELGDLWPERAALFARAWGAVLPAYAAETEERR